MNLKDLISAIWDRVQSVWAKISGEARRDMKVVIRLVENIKNYVDDGRPVLDAVIPSDAGKRLDEVIRLILPKLVVDLHLADGCLNSGDMDAVLRCAFKKLKNSTDDARDILLHGLGSKLIQRTSSSPITWQDVIGLAEMIYRTFFYKK